MRKTIGFMLLAGALSACNAADDDAARVANAADAAGDSIVNVVDESADAIGNGVENAGNAIAGAVEPGRYDEWVGRWIGVEGMYLDIAKVDDAGGKYTLDMQWDLDHNGTFEGTATGDGIRFTRPDGTYTLKPSDGDATGLKYLAGKKDCLKVKDGEGYCRD